MTLKSYLVAGLLLMLGACAAPVERPATFAPPPKLDASVMLGELSRVAALTGDQRRRELTGLEGERRLDDTQRFQLAALLEREDSMEALERSLKSLNAMADGDTRAQALLDLMKRSLKSRIELRQQTARTQELQDKLEQIKALEKSLQQRNGTPKAP